MSDPLLIQMLTTSMRYNAERQGVLARNISNLDTPNYRAQDLKKLDFGKLADEIGRQLEMRATSPTHLSGTLGQGLNYKGEKLRKPFEVTPVGNSVVLEEQMAKISDTGAKFELSTTMLKKFTGLYRTALGNRG